MLPGMAVWLETQLKQAGVQIHASKAVWYAPQPRFPPQAPIGMLTDGSRIRSCIRICAVTYCCL